MLTSASSNTSVKVHECYIHKALKTPHLTRLTKNEWFSCISDFAKGSRKARFGAFYINRYGMNGYTNPELFYASDLKAMRMLEGYTFTGTLGILPTQGDKNREV